MAIDFTHKEYKEHHKRWETIDNVCEGHEVAQYLIELNPDDKSTENTTRNTAYKERAVFYPIAGRTAEGLVSLMFSKRPKLEVPKGLEYMGTNCDGAGVSIYQQSQNLASDIVKVARGGLFTTYPKVDRELSVDDMDTGNYFATIHEYEADQIINWEQKKFGAQVKLSLVVLMEEVDVPGEDDYEVKQVKQIREFKLVESEAGYVFSMQLWRKNDKDEWIVFGDATIPVDGWGKTWDIIPFTFVGAESNNAEVDNSIMYGMSKLNIAHYRNSADFEDSTWYVGQSQPWMSGVDQTHVDMMKDNNMYVGSRMMLGVPTGETFGFASADSNPMVRQAMLDKLDGMIGMGARYIQPNGVAKTATEADGDNAVAHSTLAMISHNVGEAYTQSLKWAARYMKLPDTDIAYVTSTEFVSPEATAQMIQAMIAGYLQGAIPTSSYFAWLKSRELVEADKTIEQFTEDVGGANMPNLDDA